MSVKLVLISKLFLKTRINSSRYNIRRPYLGSFYASGGFTAKNKRTKIFLLVLSMNQPLFGSSKLLLVGDGDFSFTVALTNYVEPSNIITSNLETEESIKRYKKAKLNMENLKEKGCQVILNLDATKLHEDGDLKNCVFERIIFNFPHIGGKSNNKKNRALLKDFFKSAAAILSPSGEIMVTLCHGQGGTPADSVQRLWPNTWQVVSMAADSSLILTKVLPFQSELYTQYSCTGFRSQDKGFSTTGGLTHVFQLQESVSVSDTVPLTPLSFPKGTLNSPPYLHSKLHNYKEIMQHSSFHPLKTVLSELKLTFSSVQPCQTIPESSSQDFIIHHHNLVLLSPTVLIDPQVDINVDPLSIVYHLMKGPTGFIVDQSSGQTSMSEYHLRTSLLENVPELLQTEDFGTDQMLLLQGLVFKKGHILDNYVPVSLELLGILPQEETLPKTDQFFDLISKVLGKIGVNVSCSYLETQQLTESSTISVACVSQISHSCDDTKRNLGTIWRIYLKNDKKQQTFLAFLLDIPTFAQVTFSIEPKYLLWEPDFGKYSTKPSTLMKGVCKQYSPLTLYPLQFNHDMSFWENPDLSFDELQFHNIVRDVTGDCVSNISLIDTYKEPDTHRISRCYRLTFQSWHRCLSYDTSWKLQSFLRIQVAHQMSIILR